MVSKDTTTSIERSGRQSSVASHCAKLTSAYRAFANATACGSISSPQTLRAPARRRNQLPNTPVPQATSSTSFPFTYCAANAYRSSCSRKRCSAVLPGTIRSPVNSNSDTDSFVLGMLFECRSACVHFRQLSWKPPIQLNVDQIGLNLNASMSATLHLPTSTVDLRCQGFDAGGDSNSTHLQARLYPLFNCCINSRIA